ncbi:MAG TPA: glycosyltransferase family 1 protein [Mycobacteriales bacterium]|nr:glycosyltransferase family 1 protein [Mycobacteriales bacterium]
MIAVNGRFLRSRPSGMHRVGRELLDGARRQGLECEVLAPPGVADPRVDRFVAGPPGKAGDLLWEQLALPWAARGRTLLSFANTAPVRGARNAVLVHDLAFVVGPQWFGRATLAYSRLVLSAARRAPLVLTVSETVAGELAGAGVPRERIVVVHNAVGSQFRPAPADTVEAVRARHGLHSPYLLMIGWADPRKDVATAVRAHLEAQREVPHDLVVIGQQHSSFAAADTPSGPSVRYLGYADEQDLVPLLTGAAGLVYPSLYEGFGLPPLEAMACGTPALVSDLPVLRESAQGQATYLPVRDVPAWSAAMLAAVRGELPTPAPAPWTWDDAGQVLVDALQRVG